MHDIGSNIVVAYSLALCAALLFIACVHFRSELSKVRDLIRVPVLKHLVYRPALGSRILVDWSRADILTRLVYLTATIFCLCFNSHDIASAGLRAANLSLIHMVLLFASPHLDSLSNALGLRWRSVDRHPFPLDKPENLWGLVSSSSLGALLLSGPFFKRKWYELFLRLHQGLAILLVYGLWTHLTNEPLLPRIYLYSLLGICGLSGLWIGFLMLRRNAVLSRGFPRATITQSRGAIINYLAIERLLNNALDDDTLDDGYTKILQISVYVEHAKRDDKISPRANVIKGVPDWDTIVREEVAGKHIKRVQEEAKTRENMIVTVSASSGIRIKMQDVVQGYIAKEVEMVELDYQPDE
ncbi:ferric reductase like transmembrane component domain-containing protein [Hirsutella rhossiliensis]